jgi:hypothetical protein
MPWLLLGRFRTKRDISPNGMINHQGRRESPLARGAYGESSFAEGRY